MSAMHKFSSAMAGIGLALLQTVSLQVQAAPPVQMAVQILDPSGVCASWTTGGSILAPTITCNAGTPPPPGAPVCTISANGQNPLTISAAGLVALSASCTNTDANTTWAWTGAGASSTTPAGATPGTQSLTVSATTTFGVIATNSNGPSNNPTVVVTVGTPPPPPPPAAGDCPGYANLTRDMGVVAMNGVPSISTGFGSGTIAVATLQVPQGAYSRNVNQISIYEYGGVATSRRGYISKARCDMSGQAVGGTAPAFSFDIGGPAVDPLSGMIVHAVMQPGETWYVMVVNVRSNGASSCTSGTCNIAIKWYPPN